MGTGKVSAPKTLGNILYTDKTRPVVSEEAWVGLVRAIAAGDQRALLTLYEEAYRIVYTLSVRIVNDRHAAEEVTLDVFHDVWRRAATYDPDGGSVVGWIMNQTRSRAIDRLRFEQRKKRVNPSGEPVTATAPEDPVGTLDVKEQGRHVREALNVLTPDERTAIEAAFFSELTYPEVATRLQQPLGTVKTRIRSGLAKLRHALAARKAL
jgi:RNA polymerase sigma-70 factor (ECF subfamily)